MGKTKLPKVTPQIMGISPIKKEGKIIRLHNHPNAIKESLKDLMEMCEDESVKSILEDISVLANYALDKLPLMTPKKEEAKSNDELGS